MSVGQRRSARQRDRPAQAIDASSFQANVFDVVRRIPRGRVTTYGDVARMAGRPGAARAVGRLMAMGTLPHLPYHRVVGAGGALGGYGPGAAFKAAQLGAEGIVVRRNRIAGFRECQWTGDRAATIAARRSR